MKRSLAVVVVLVGLAFCRPLYLLAIDNCEMPPIPKQGFEDPNQIVGKYLGGKYAVHKQPIIFDLDLWLNDPNLQWEIVGSVPVEGQTVTWSGDKGVHYLYFQLQDTSSAEVLDEGTVAIKCVPRGQFRGVIWR